MLAILQPHVPHYRTPFFKGISEKVAADIYIYEDQEKTSSEGFSKSEIPTKYVRNMFWKEFLIYDPVPFLDKKYNVLVLMLHFGHLSTWFLLFTKVFHRKQIILFGHGISVKRYIKEEAKPSILLKWMIFFSDGIWLYTENEKKIWDRLFPKKNIVALVNTIPNVCQNYRSNQYDKNLLKIKYNIRQKFILIFSARFTNPHRRTDILLKAVKQLDQDMFGFVIIGDGPLKPDFSSYTNVYEFGSLYDDVVKGELFFLSDIYFQPAWVGLSIAEALSFGKPVFTFKRTSEILQCVEYAYIIHKVNGYIFNNFEEFLLNLNQITPEEIQVLSINAKNYASEKLSMDKMVNNAVTSIKSI